MTGIGPEPSDGTAYETSHAGARGRATVSILGRAQVLGRLSAMVSRVADGDRVTALVAGSTDMGKTTLLGALAEDAIDQRCASDGAPVWPVPARRVTGAPADRADIRSSCANSPSRRWWLRVQRRCRQRARPPLRDRTAPV